MQILGTALVGIVIFKEPVNVVLVLVCIVALIIGVNLAVYKESNEEVKKIDYQIIMDLILSTVGFVVYATVIRYFGVETKAAILPQTMGMLIGALALNSSNVKALIDKKVLYNMIAGLLWFLGNMSMLLSSEYFGITIAFAVSQLNVAVSVSAAILILKEHKTRKELVYIVTGIVLIILSGIFISRA